MIVFYKDKRTGDYLGVDRETNDYFNKRQWSDHLQARGPAIAGDPSSVHTCVVSRRFLKDKCVRVALRNVPCEWQDAIGIR